MNDRLVTLFGAMAALALFVALVLPPVREPDVSRPVSTAIGANGYAGMQRWLDAGGIRTVSLRRRYDEIAGQLELAGEARSFEPGEALFVPAGVEHRFVDFSDDFAAWVVFYGPPGGEAHE